VSKEISKQEGFNRVVIIGEVSSVPISRDLTDGSVVTTFDVVSSTEVGRVTVPVSVDGVPSVVEEGVSVCIVGFVRRRFFKAGASVASRTEVVANVITPVRRKAQVRKAIEMVADDLSDLLDA
jgi:hypothetical protein